jgi:hypothetical protein
MTSKYLRDAAQKHTTAPAIVNGQPKPVRREKFVPVTTRKCNVVRDELGVVLVLTVSTTRATMEPLVEVSRYHVESLPSPLGVAFRLSKTADTVGTDPTEREYCVLVESEADTCECKSAQKRGTCRHLEAIRACRKAGKL